MRAPGTEHPCRDADSSGDASVTVYDYLSTVYWDISTLAGYAEWIGLVQARADAEQRLLNSHRYFDQSVQPI